MSGPLEPKKEAVEPPTHALYAITVHGLAAATRLAAALPGAVLYVSAKLMDKAPAGAQPLAFPLGPQLAQTWPAYGCHVFFASVGAVVRLTAPLLKNKKEDPAVVAVDDAARFAVCVLSGHLGGGNRETSRVAALLGATPVITTASDVLGTLAVDILGAGYGWRLDCPDKQATLAAAAMVNGRPVAVVQEAGETGWRPETLPQNVALFDRLEQVRPDDFEALVVITDRLFEQSHPAHWAKAIVHRPKSLALGLGCDKATPPLLVARGVKALLARNGYSVLSVKAVASIDIKAQEPALLELAQAHGWPFLTYPGARLDGVEGMENPSEVVKRHTGSRGVAEPACLLAAGAKKLLVAKQSYTEEGAGRSMTLALARYPAQ